MTSSASPPVMQKLFIKCYLSEYFLYCSSLSLEFHYISSRYRMCMTERCWAWLSLFKRCAESAVLDHFKSIHSLSTKRCCSPVCVRSSHRFCLLIFQLERVGRHSDLRCYSETPWIEVEVSISDQLYIYSWPSHQIMKVQHCHLFK
jgi:hypothetical protein